MTYRKFSDSSVRPPRGGWSYPIGGELVTQYSEDAILEAMAKWNRNNNTGKSIDQLRAELWTYYCGNQPDRCGHGSIEVNVADVTIDTAVPVVPANKTPELQGPPIWGFLNTLAAQWNPSIHDYFLATCDAIITILDCPICSNEWRNLLALYPPSKLASRSAVCKWVNLVHNKVNARKGKAPYSYARMIAEWGAPP